MDPLYQKSLRLQALGGKQSVYSGETISGTKTGNQLQWPGILPFLVYCFFDLNTTHLLVLCACFATGFITLLLITNQYRYHNMVDAPCWTWR